MHPPQYRPAGTKQRGAALLVMLAIIVMGITAALVGSLGSTALKNARQETTAAALAQAKAALIGYAVSDPNRPGELPCPDFNNDGMITIADDYAGSSCKSLIGRLPWKTLKLPNLRDGDSEPLWYALSDSFHANGSGVLNSNTKGTLQVYDSSGAALITQPGSEAVAIVFAPGNIVASQQRDTANQNSPQNYMDTGPNNINNYTPAGPFIAAGKNDTFNDRLMIIVADDIIPTVEMRVTKELANAFAAYANANSNKYPHPANFANCTSASCPSDTAQCTGKVPVTDMAAFLPAWFAANQWFDVIYYATGTASLAGIGGGGGSGKWKRGRKGGSGGAWGGSSGSTACSAANLTVLDIDGEILTTHASALFLMPGTPLSIINRSPMSSSPNNLADYFEEIENQNLDIIYIMPSDDSNDALYVLP